MKKKNVRTRIAPSPTGQDIHIGNVYTALINYAWAKKYDGAFIVRIEDTDRKRLVEGSENRILSSLKWFGLTPDEGVGIGGPYKPYRQSERLDLYKKYAEQLVKDGHAYYCDCSPDRLATLRKEQQKKDIPPKYDRHCLNRQEKVDKSKAVIRMKIPESGNTEFTDLIRGKISIENTILDDQVILKSDGFPTYHLGVVVDDHVMEISYVIRAEEWISSTPKHILLYQFLGWELPRFAHLPILRNPNKSKLSKRKNPVWASWYRETGFLPEAILNYLATLGWSHPEGKDIFDLNEFIANFDLKDVQKTGPVFDVTKLEWMNGEYIRNMQESKLVIHIVDFLDKAYNEQVIEKTVPLIQTRIKKLSDYMPLCEFFFQAPKKYEKEINKEWIEKVIKTIESMDEWTHDSMYSQLSKRAEELGVSKSKLFMDIRIAVTGKKIGPPLFESMEILGKEESIKRLRKSLQ